METTDGGQQVVTNLEPINVGITLQKGTFFCQNVLQIVNKLPYTYEYTSKKVLQIICVGHGPHHPIPRSASDDKGLDGGCRHSIGLGSGGTGFLF